MKPKNVQTRAERPRMCTFVPLSRKNHGALLKKKDLAGAW
jgi:hypothetical protein